MNSVERITAAFTGQLPDRVPVAGWLSLPLIRRLVPDTGLSELFDRWIEDPCGSIIALQESFGLDPIVITFSEHTGEVHLWPEKIFRWPDEALKTWRAEKQTLDRGPGLRVVRHVVTTPEGELSWTYRVENNSLWPLEYMLKEESDLDLLQYRPNPQLLNIRRLQGMARKVRDRGFFNHCIPGVWDGAAELRGATQVMMDLYERPKWLKRLLAVLKDRLIRHVRRLGQAGIHAIVLDETWVGAGLSRQVYEEFILPYDREVVRVAQEAGLMVSYHNCGQGSQFLEQMVSTGAEALETLTPRTGSGDFDLADVKRRVGNRICLYGGFDERILAQDSPQKVADEVKRCLDAAADGGRYILRTAGQIFSDAKLRNIEVMARTVREYGRY